MKKNGYTMIELLIVIVILGVITAITVSTTSYAFKDKTNDYYEEKTYGILNQAEKYGQTLDNLKKEESIIITASDLIKSGYYIADDSDGNITDPRNSKGNLNGLKIKLTYEKDGNVKASLIED